VTDFALYATVAIIGLAIGLLSIVALTGRLRSSAASTLDPRRIATGTAIGLGLHNLSEGLAIGSSAASGATELAVLLVVGFALHNATEGFGIVGPMAGEGTMPSWRFLALLGLIGGGPTFVGTLIGQAWTSTGVSVVFFAIAAGSILYVVLELVKVNQQLAPKTLITWFVLFGLLLGFATEFVVEAAGV